jgi:hypothetical protein
MDIAAAMEAPAGINAVSALEAAVSPPSLPRDWPEAGTDTLRPSHVDPSPAFSAEAVQSFRPRPPWKALLAAAIVALAGAIALAVRSGNSEPPPIAASPPPKPIATLSRAPAPPPPAVTAPPAPEASAAPAGSGFAASFASALSGSAADSVAVTVHVSPAGAAIFRHGERLGADEVTVNVPKGGKTTLVAQLEGYLPRSIVVDSTTKSVNIVLSRPDASRAAFAPAAAKVGATPSKSDEPTPTRASQAAGTPTGSGDAPKDSSGAKAAPSKPSSTGTAEWDPSSDVGLP